MSRPAGAALADFRVLVGRPSAHKEKAPRESSLGAFDNYAIGLRIVIDDLALSICVQDEGVLRAREAYQEPFGSDRFIDEVRDDLNRMVWVVVPAAKVIVPLVSS